MEGINVEEVDAGADVLGEVVSGAGVALVELGVGVLLAVTLEVDSDC